MAAATRRTPRLPPQVRRRQVLDAALEIASSEGFESMTIDRVARAAGITRPVVYDQFGDLDGLVGALIDDAEEQALSVVGRALPGPEPAEAPDEALAEAMRTFVAAVRSQPDVWRVILLPADGTPRVARERIERRRAELAQGMAELIELVAERDGMPAGIDSRILARVLMAAAEELGRAALESPRRLTPTRVGRAMAQMARLVSPGDSPARRGGR